MSANTPSGSNLYSQGFGATSSNAFPGNAIKATRPPSTTDVRGPQGNYSIGQFWVDTIAEAPYQLVGLSPLGGSVSATWVSLGGGTSSLSQLTGNTGIAFPVGGSIAIAGGNGISTVASGATVTISATGTGSTKSVSVDAHTSPGTNPVTPSSGGQITVTGAQVAAGVVGTNVIRTDSLATNTYTIEIQRSQAAASSTVADNGVSHFSSNDFSVDSNGFVTLASASTPITTGTFTPSLIGTGITYGSATGSYLAIGTPGTGNAMIFASLDLSVTDIGTSSGPVNIAGLPFTEFAGDGVGGIYIDAGVNISTGYGSIVPLLTGSSSTVGLFQSPVGTTGSSEALPFSNLVPDAVFSITINYRA